MRWRCLECGHEWTLPEYIDEREYDGEITCWACKRLNVVVIRDREIIDQSLSGYTLDKQAVKTLLEKGCH